MQSIPDSNAMLDAKEGRRQRAHRCLFAKDVTAVGSQSLGGCVFSQKAGFMFLSYLVLRGTFFPTVSCLELLFLRNYTTSPEEMNGML